MFEVTKFFVEFKARLIIAAIIAAVVGAGYLYWQSREDKIDKLKETVVTQKIENGSLKVAVKDGVETAAITEKINVEVVEEKQVVEKVHEKVKQRTVAKVKQIEDTYEALPKTPENTAALDNATSAAMIDGLWDSYCAGDAGELRCAAPVAPNT